MTLPDSLPPKKEPDPYKRCMWAMVIVGILLVTILVLLITNAEAQVSVFTDPESDAIVFEDKGTTIEVTPYGPGYEVSIPSGFGYDSTFIVSPDGYVTRTFEVDE